MNLKNYYYYFQSALSTKLCDDILKYGKLHKSSEGLTDVSENFKNINDISQLSDLQKKEIYSKRKSKISWLKDNWIFKEILPYVHQANKLAGWNFDFDYTESSQFTIYEEGQYYGWHTDSKFEPYSDNSDKNFNGKIRKLSVTVSLNDSTEYEGGLLQFSLRNDKDFEKNSESATKTCFEILPRGSIVVFPSFVWHRVTPVTKGTRYSLVMWNLGYPFR